MLATFSVFRLGATLRLVSSTSLDALLLRASEDPSPTRDAAATHTAHGGEGGGESSPFPGEKKDVTVASRTNFCRQDTQTPGDGRGGLPGLRGSQRLDLSPRVTGTHADPSLPSSIPLRSCSILFRYPDTSNFFSRPPAVMLPSLPITQRNLEYSSPSHWTQHGPLGKGPATIPP